MGVILAAVLFVPFLAASYRARGRVTLARTLQWIALLIAFLALWSYTILPAPLPTSPYACRVPNLDLTTDLRDILAIQESGTSILANEALQVVLLNVLFFVPIGFLVRTLFSWGVVRGALVGFALSLAVETTQLTGLWGIYPCAYRLFSVNDLLDNTLGAVVGSLLALLFVRRTRARADDTGAVSLLVPVRIGRRLLAAAADLVLFVSVALSIGLLVAILGQAAGRTGTDRAEESLGFIVALVVYAAPVLLTGATWGERAVLIEAGGGWTPRVLSPRRAGGPGARWGDGDRRVRARRREPDRDRDRRRERDHVARTARPSRTRRVGRRDADADARARRERTGDGSAEERRGFLVAVERHGVELTERVLEGHPARCRCRASRPSRPTRRP